MRIEDICIGDKVCYSSKWLRSCGIFTGPIPFARGIVKGIENNGVVVVDWRDDQLTIPSKVFCKNLSVVHPDKGILEEV